eukprot:gene42209-52334_t
MLPNLQRSGQAAAPSLLVAAPDKSLSQYRLDGWQIEQGLPQNAVAALLHTSDGYLWVGTLGGLARFDGHRFTTFDASEFADIASQPVLGLMQDAQQNLWIGHNKGAAKAGHLQRVADQAAGFFGQILQVRVHVVVRHHDRVLFFQQTADLVLERGTLGLRGLGRHAGPGNPQPLRRAARIRR